MKNPSGSLLLATAIPFHFGGFIDTYYALDSNNPPEQNREFTTQPTRHNEFSLNLAFLEASFSERKKRGRLALQYGDSVTVNTADETKEELRNMQEAFVGVKVGEKTWIDGGLFLAHLGPESWISRDNWTYTRALNSDYVPYYSSGLRLEHRLHKEEYFQLHLLNGWQNYGENNTGKAIGLKYEREITSGVILTYNNFTGDEEVVSSMPRFRSYHNFNLKWLASDQWQFLFSLDFGHQSQQAQKGVDGWVATSHTIRRVLNKSQAVALRIEYYNDPHEANILTGTPHGFEVLGASVNFDQEIAPKAWWRTEVRGFYSKDPIYPATDNDRNRWDGFIVTSLSASF